MIDGRRRPDSELGELPTDLQVGDYWKVMHRRTGEPLTSDAPTNLTGYVWMIYAPGGIGMLTSHTVREEDDGTISVRAGDGSSNSIHVDGAAEWHGYVEHGQLYEVTEGHRSVM